MSLTVTSPPPQLSVANGLLSFTSSSIPPQAQSQALQIQNVGGGSLTINSGRGCEASWCTVGGFPSTVNAGPGANVNVTVDPSTLQLGFYRTAVDVSTSAGNASVPVTFFITAIDQHEPGSRWNPVQHRRGEAARRSNSSVSFTGQRQRE